MTRRWPFGALASALVTALQLSAPASAGAQQGWVLPPVAVSAVSGTLRSINAPDIASDAAGNAVAVWAEMDPNFRTHVMGARFDAASETWSAPRRLSDGLSTTVLEQHVVMDTAGNTLVLWSQAAGGSDWTVYSTRLLAGASTWSVPEIRSTGSASDVRLAMNAAGDAVAIWSVYGTLAPGPPPGVYAVRFAGATGIWSAAERLGPVVQTGVPGIDVAIDGAGNLFAAWHYTAVEARRYSVTTGQWAPAVTLSGTLAMPQIGQLRPMPRLATNSAGDAIASWTNGGVVEVTRYQHTSDTWTPAARISSGGDDSQRGVIDANGNVVVAWHHNAGTTRTLQAARLDQPRTAWSAPVDLAAPGAPIPLVFNYGAPAVVADPRGNVLVLASRSTDGTEVRLVSAYFVRSTATWAGASDLSRARRDARLPNVAMDAAGNAMAVWFEGNGATSTNQAMRWRITAGSSAVTTVEAAPGALSVGFTTAAPADPALAPTNIEYSLDGGATWTRRAPADATSPLLLTGLVDGVIQAVRIRALNGAGTGPASAVVRMRSGADARPGHLRVVSRAGSVVTFAWTPPAAGIVADRYVLEGGVNGQVLAQIDTGGAGSQFTVSVPDGTFFVRVVAAAGSARGPASADTVLAVNTSAVPPSPTGLLGSVAGHELALSWQNQFAGATPTSLVLHVSGTITASLTLPVVESFTYAGVPPGTYTFTVSAMNGPLPGVTGSAVTLTFPGSCAGAPQPPQAFSATTQGGRIFLDWLPPSSGAAVTHYVVSATGAVTGSFPMTARTFSTLVTPGTYTVRVAAVGPCGTSTATTPQAVVVP